jgi:hypothetical protein
MAIMGERASCNTRSAIKTSHLSWVPPNHDVVEKQSFKKVCFNKFIAMLREEGGMA